MVALKQLRENVAATIIPRSERPMRRTSRNDFESWKRRIHREMAVGIDFHTGRMIDGEETHLIEIIKFLLGFNQTKFEAAIFQLDVGAVDLKILGGIRDISLARA